MRGETALLVLVQSLDDLELVTNCHSQTTFNRCDLLTFFFNAVLPVQKIGGRLNTP
jgi:hypothetical protein